MKFAQLLDRDDEGVGVEGPRGNPGRPGDQPDGYSRKDGGKKRREEDRLPGHLVDLPRNI